MDYCPWQFLVSLWHLVKIVKWSENWKIGSKLWNTLNTAHWFPDTHKLSCLKCRRLYFWNWKNLNMFQDCNNFVFNRYWCQKWVLPSLQIFGLRARLAHDVASCHLLPWQHGFQLCLSRVSSILLTNFKKTDYYNYIKENHHYLLFYWI